ncbi:MAG: bacterial cell division membrane protein [Parcubacteria group bacterium GW2011_GWC1_41_7]|nr:MAG: bacterial cell division membrane protein [Parcubacteria group bacterium GW2011_GWC1_41_7]
MRDSLRQVRNTTRTLVRRHNPDYKIMMYTTILVLIGLIIIFAIGPQRANVLNESFGSDLSEMHFVIKQGASVIMAIGRCLSMVYRARARYLPAVGVAQVWCTVISGCISSQADESRIDKQ